MGQLQEFLIITITAAWQRHIATAGGVIDAAHVSIESLHRLRAFALIQLQLRIRQHGLPFGAAILACHQFDVARVHGGKQLGALRIAEHKQIKADIGVGHETQRAGHLTHFCGNRTRR